MLIPLGGIFFLISVVFWLWAIFDSITSDRTRVRLLPKWAWIAVVVFFAEVGALVWVLFGRPRAGVGGNGSGGGPGGGSGFPRPRPSGPSSFGPRPSGPRAPVGPDDDPEFLRKL